MNIKHVGVMSLALLGAISVQAAGFALYGGSAKGMSLGGAVMGQAIDASANFYNPALITDFDKTVVTLGMGTETPFANVKCRYNDMYGNNRKYTTKMDPGTFLLPHVYVVQPLPCDFSFGFGIAPEYGLGSAYNPKWPMNWNSNKTDIEGLVFNPNLAYKVTDDWSVSTGFRLLYFSFAQRSSPLATNEEYPGLCFGQANTRLSGNNGFSDFGFQVSSAYKITDTLTAGVMYRSAIHTRIRGHYKTALRSYNQPVIDGMVNQMLPGAVYQYGMENYQTAITPTHPMYNTIAAGVRPAVEQGVKDKIDAGIAKQHGRGAANITLPQSVTAGLNWQASETVNLGYAMTWTHWSSMDKIKFRLAGGDKTVPLHWSDVFRFAFGGSWQFADDWTFMGSYVFDMDPCSKKLNQGSTMLPPGNRHAVTAGLAYRISDNWELSGTYGIIIMKGRSQKFTDDVGREYRYSTNAGRSHQCGLTLSYYF